MDIELYVLLSLKPYSIILKKLNNIDLMTKLNFLKKFSQTLNFLKF